MFLKSLEVRGFKSFADKTELKFKKGVTAVVGPNGSGKSNISDSVRWVLGEQSVKSLRGGKMEDVIFAGTQFRKPVGLAQVSLTLENSDGSLPIEYNEVTITRRIFRSGETEYLINNQKCRLKDITELFMDTGIGKEGYSLIGQGKIDAILSGKPEDRRALFEEAAGIVKYKARKEEAEKKLDNTDNNLVRIRDIISTYEERLEPLKEEKEKALKYKALADELKEKDISLIVHYINNIKTNIESLAKELAHSEKSISVKRETVEGHKKEITNLEQAIEELEIKNKSEKDEYFKEKQAISQNINEIELFKERIHNFNELIKKEKSEIQVTEERITLILEEKEHLEKAVVNKENELRFKVEELKEIEKSIVEIAEIISKIENELIELKGNEFEYLSKNSEINNTLIAIDKEIKNKANEKSNLEVKINNLESNLAINIGTIEKFRENIKKSRNEILIINDKVTELKKSLSSNHSRLNSEEKTIREVSKNISQAEATHNTLSNLEKHYEGYNRTVKTLMEHVSNKKVQGVSDVKVVGEIFKVEQQFEVAIEIALGAAISNVITKTEEDAKKLISYLKAQSLGRATFLPQNIIRGRRIDVSKEVLAVDGYLGIASDVISFSKEYQGIIDYNLGRTLVAKDMDCAIKISKLGKHSYKIVTLSGEVVNPGGALTGGSIQGKNTNLLGRKREIEELAKNIEKYRKYYVEVANKIHDIKANIKSIDEEIINKREEIHQKNIELTIMDGEIKNLIAEGENLKRSINGCNEIIKINTEVIAKLTKKKEENTSYLKIINEKNTESKDRVLNLESDLKNNKFRLEELKEMATDIKISKATHEENVQGLKLQLKNKIDDLTEKEYKVKTLSIEIKDKKENIDVLTNTIVSKEDTIKSINEKILLLEETFKEDEITRVKLKDDLKAKETVASELNEVIRLEENSLNKIAIQHAKLESEEEAYLNRLNNELNLTLVEAREIAIDVTDIQKLKDKISYLKSKISALGTVNLSAIIEYDEVLEKYEFMSTQELDLQKAKEELLSVIDEMTLKMQELFRENFKILNENFGETFKELFKGGSAELILGEGDELQANIVINVQPPGKKLQNINLMSGGEKVLSAIALLFAILKMKPTPFCILDEIEAALDDANVYRYAEFLKKFAAGIQFIVITHRKGTMEASDMMYGITMEEKGVSKVVSVDLTDY